MKIFQKFKNLFLLSISIIPLFSLQAQALSPALSENFIDVSSLDPYYSAVEYLADLEVVEGYEDGTYQPSRFINRAEFLKIALEAAKAPVTERSSTDQKCFSDVENSEWYAKYVCFAASKGFIEGYEDGEFKPLQTVNLVEALKMTMVSFNYQYDASVQPWYQDLVKEASANNFIPLEFTNFTQTVNRGQMADMVARVLWTENEQSIPYSSYNVSFQSLSNNEDVIEKIRDIEGCYGWECTELYWSVCTSNSNGCGLEELLEFKFLQFDEECHDPLEQVFAGITFAKCNGVPSSSPSEVSTGGLLANNFYLITEVDEDLQKIYNYSQLYNILSPLNSKAKATNLAVAFSGYMPIYEENDFELLLSENNIPDSALIGFDTSQVKYSNVIQILSSGYEVSLYSIEKKQVPTDIEGAVCYNDNLLEHTYQLSNSGNKDYSQVEIGTLREYCVN